MNPLALTPELLPELIARLTPRQREIVHLLAEGRSNKHIATILSISQRTIKNHTRRACERLELENRTQLIVIYVMWKTIGVQ